MSTINGVAFNLRQFNIISTHRSVRTDQPGSDTSFITDMGYNGLQLKLTGFETSLSDYDDVMGEFMASGEQILSVMDDWQFRVHSVQATPTLEPGKPNYFPYSFRLITSTPYRESTSETIKCKNITTNNQEWSAGDSLTESDFQANAGTGDWTNPSNINDGSTSSTTMTDTIGKYIEIDFGSNFYIKLFKHRGYSSLSGDGTFKIQHWDGLNWVDNTLDIGTLQASWSSWLTLTTPIVTSKIRIVATIIDSFGYIVISEMEMTGNTDMNITTGGNVEAKPSIKITSSNTLFIVEQQIFKF